MSLLASTNSGSTSVAYFMENIGSQGGVNTNTPCIKGSTTGAIRVGDAETGLVLRGDVGGVSSFIRGGANAASNLTLGSSSVSFNNIVLTDGLTTVNTSVAMPGAGSSLVLDGDIGLGGDLILTNGQAEGRSISGYYSLGVSVNVSGAGTFPVPTPAGITPGWYMIAVAQPAGSGANNGARMPGCIGYRTTANLWNIGGYGGDLSTFYIKPTDDHTALEIVSADARANTTVVFTKVLN